MNTPRQCILFNGKSMQSRVQHPVSIHHVAMKNHKDESFSVQLEMNKSYALHVLLLPKQHVLIQSTIV